jgi:hypothetical protein
MPQDVAQSVGSGSRQMAAVLTLRPDYARIGPTLACASQSDSRLRIRLSTARPLQHPSFPSFPVPRPIGQGPGSNGFARAGYLARTGATSPSNSRHQLESRPASWGRSSDDRRTACSHADPAALLALSSRNTAKHPKECAIVPPTAPSERWHVVAKGSPLLPAAHSRHYRRPDTVPWLESALPALDAPFALRDQL